MDGWQFHVVVVIIYQPDHIMLPVTRTKKSNRLQRPFSSSKEAIGSNTTMEVESVLCMNGGEGDASYAEHSIVQVPNGLNDEEGVLLNKGKIYVSKSSPPCVSKVYLEQFQEDFISFLHHRSKELVQDGRMVLILQTRDGSDPSSKEATYDWEILADALSTMVFEGLIQQEKVDACNMPYYTPSPQEIQDIVLKEGSFKVERIEKLAVDFVDENMQDMWVKAETIAKNIRCYTEPIISYHFGEENLDKLYDKFTHLLEEDFTKEIIKLVSVIVVLKRRN